MTYNVSWSEVVSNEGAWMYLADVRLLYEKYNSEKDQDVFLPELNPLEGALPAGGLLSKAPDEQGRVFITTFEWEGEWSGEFYEELLVSKIMPLIHGKIVVLFCWEEGDKFTKLRVVDGKITRLKTKVRHGRVR